jgi:hypothetical protein
MTAALRQRCRNSKCGVKLGEPVGNAHKAFCCRGCHSAFYHTRCLVCEKAIDIDPMSGEKRKRLGQRKFCGRRCQAEARRYPHVYGWVPPDPVRRTHSSRSAHSTGIKFGIAGYRPIAHCLRDWWWGDPGIGDLSLYNKDGLTIARIVLGSDGRYHLRTPVATPRMSWADLDEAKCRAESLALMSIPLATVDPKLAARIKRDNSTPHPMGPPLSRPWPVSTGDAVLIGAGTKLAFKSSGPWSDDLAIPDCLRRRP